MRLGGTLLSFLLASATKRNYHSQLRPLGLKGVRGKRPITAGKDRTMEYVESFKLGQATRKKMDRYTLHGLYQRGKSFQRLSSVGGLL